MAQLLKQSTAYTFRIGPFVDSTDGVTAETALSIAQADIQISKAGGAFAQTSASSPTTTHDADGWYQCPLTTTDTGTLGHLTVQVTMAGALPVWRDFTVVPAMVYDSLVAGTDDLDTNVIKVGNTSQTAADLGVLPTRIPGNITITSGRVDADVTHWKTGTVATPTTAGIPDVGVLYWGTGPQAVGVVNGLPDVHLGNVAHGGSAGSLVLASATLGTAGSGVAGLAVAGGNATLGALDIASVSGLMFAARGATGNVTMTSAGGVVMEGNLTAGNITTAGTLSAGTNGLPWPSAWDAEVQSECADALVAYDPPTDAEMVAAFTEIKGATWATTDSLEAIRDRGDAAWTTGAGGTPPQLLQSTTIATLSSQTSFTLTAGSADDDAYNGAIVVVTDASTSTQKAVGTVSDYTGSTKTVTLAADPGIFTMAATDNIVIIAALGSGPTAVQVRTEIDSNSTQLAAIVADTNELQADWANGGRLDLILDATLADTADMQPKIGTPATDLSADIAAVKVDTAATLIDTAEIGAAGVGLTNLGGMSTGMKAEVNAEADTAITDASLATAAALATADAVVDAIKAKTDSLTFTVANQVDSNTQYVNDVAITGNGTTGNEWGP